jgi:hypothetical protein
MFGRSFVTWPRLNLLVTLPQAEKLAPQELDNEEQRAVLVSVFSYLAAQGC